MPILSEAFPSLLTQRLERAEHPLAAPCPWEQEWQHPPGAELTPFSWNANFFCRKNCTSAENEIFPYMKQIPHKFLSHQILSRAFIWMCPDSSHIFLLMFPDLKSYPKLGFGIFFSDLPISTNMVGMICQHILFCRADLKNRQKINGRLIIISQIFHFGALRFIWCSHLCKNNHRKPEWFGKELKNHLIPTLWDGERHFSLEQERKNRPERKKKIRIFQVQHSQKHSPISTVKTSLNFTAFIIVLSFQTLCSFLFSSNSYINSAKT